MSRLCSIGFDFGTESVRVIVVDVATGRVAGQAAHAVPRTASSTTRCRRRGENAPAGLRPPAPAGLARSARRRRARPRWRRAASRRTSVVGIGVDFTSCTMLPCLRRRHAAVPARAIRARCRSRGRSSGSTTARRPRRTASTRSRASATSRGSRATAARSAWSGSSRRCSRRSTTSRGVYDAADVWLEAGDWFVWQLVERPVPATARRRSSSARPARRATRRCGTRDAATRRATTSPPSHPKLRGRRRGEDARRRCRSPGTRGRRADARRGGAARPAAPASPSPPRSSTPTPASPARASRRRRRWCWSWAPARAT